MLSSRLSFRSLVRSLSLRSRTARLLAARPFLAALPLAGAVPILALPTLAAPANLTGVQAWTSGNQTYIRVRPDASTPIVAKVVKHTPLYVWGKYNGWYRVQTHDDIYGWVHYELLNSRGLGKVKNLSPAAVERAADRSANITMWGTPEQLKDYYQKHGAKGAAKGLIEMGVPITTRKKPRVVRAKAATPRQAAPRKIVGPPKPRVMTSTMAKRVDVQTPVVQQVAPPTDVAAVAAPLPTMAPVRVLPPAPPKKVVTQTAKAPVKRTKRLSAKEQKRQKLRDKMGMKVTTPPAPPITQIAPVSPEDLMKARRDYLDARKQKSQGTPNVNPETNDENLGGAKVTPSSFENANATESYALDNNGWAPFNTGGWSAAATPRAAFQTADWSAQFAPKFRLVTEEAEAATMGDEGLDEEELRRWNSLPALDSLQTTTIANAQKKPGVALRGGSPRDRYNAARSNAAGKKDFRQDFANQALSYRGMPYIFGASSPSRGFDCSGLVYYLLRKRGYNPPRTAAGYRNYGSAVARKDLKVGDLLLFANTYKRGISHIGIYIGNNNFVHAASTRQGVRTDSLSTKYFANKYYGARRVPQK